MALSRKKTKGRSDIGRYFAVPHSVMQSADWLLLSSSAIRLLLELALQYNGKNNGDLTAAWSVMNKRGFNSQDTLGKALECLLKHGFIIRSREGRFCNPGKRCALYALTWRNVDECPGKHLDISVTKMPLRQFSIENKTSSPETGASRYGNWSDKQRKYAQA